MRFARVFALGSSGGQRKRFPSAIVTMAVRAMDSWDTWGNAVVCAGSESRRVLPPEPTIYTVRARFYYRGSCMLFDILKDLF